MRKIAEVKEAKLIPPAHRAEAEALGIKGDHVVAFFGISNAL